MARPRKERTGIPTRLYADTVRILRTLASWRGVSMAEYVDELAREAVSRHSGEVIAGLQALLPKEGEESLAKRSQGKPRKQQD